ncbi:hypothetical protein [Streptomyces ochraceiscleroticus]|nr:hypothetical protein [Streptomyces ochraceiscleroticus]
MTGTDPAERIRRLIRATPPQEALAPALSLAVAAVVLALPVALALAPAALLAGTAHSGC